MNKCSNCKNWMPERKFNPALNVAYCEKLTLADFECGVMVYSLENESDFTQDFLTGKDFGCIHFESK